jgi:phosphotransferase system enzyme I (PtsI)
LIGGDKMLKGIAASSGIAIGRAFVISENVIEVKETIIQNTLLEKNLFHNSIETAKAQLETIKASAERKMGKDKAEIFGAHIMMLEDPELIGAVESSIEQNKYKAEYAVKTTIEMFASMMDSMDDEYMKERATDIRDVGQRLLNIIMEVENTAISEINKECIIVARDLTPSDTAQMDRKMVLGFVTDVGGRTSHSAIMARTLEIPAVVGTGNASSVISTYSFNVGITAARFDYATAIGLFQSIVGIIFLVAADRIAKKLGEGGLL